MPRTRAIVLLLALLPAVAPAAARDEDDDPPPAALDANLPDHALRLAPDRQRAGGLVLEPLRAASVKEEVRAYGKVQDVQPLLAFRVRHRAALAEVDVAAAALALAASNRSRVSALVREEIVAGRELVRAESEWQAARARDEAARRLVAEIRREAESSYGPELAQRVLDGDAAWLDGFATRKRQLLWVALPAGQSAPARGGTVWVARDPDRARAVPATLISPAPRTDELVQGETWYFEAAEERLRGGMRLNVWAPGEGGPLRGVIVPARAIVWHEGKPWVWRKVGADLFVRTALDDRQERPGGWFVQRGFRPGEAVVVAGGQMLLSEEFRRQIPDED